jgi:hypothetical protein
LSRPIVPLELRECVDNEYTDAEHWTRVGDQDLDLIVLLLGNSPCEAIRPEMSAHLGIHFQ